jgi:glyoxylase-like metal-dependent hydrolase (beta-lactamase superfamily II)
MREVAPGLLHWTARHPEWHPGEFGAEVGSYAALTDDELLLVDPLAAPDELDGLLRERVSILITIGYHVRSAEELWKRWRRQVQVTIYGPPNAGKRLPAKAFTELQPGDEGPAGVRAFAIGRPVRGERPLWIPSHHALAFGDAIVTNTDGELRMWIQDPLNDERAAFYRERFAPTLQPLFELPLKRVLVTHGPPVLKNAAAALRRAVEAPPWYHRG